MHLQKEIPNVKGLSVTNLKYMKKFYEMRSPLNRPQLGDDLRISQSSGNFDKIFSIPWGHQRLFTNNLPALQSDLTNEMTRDPYNFDFIAIRHNYDEKELKDALMDNIQKFLLELGTGFSFVGREYRLVVGISEYQLQNLIPESLKGALPSIEEIENELK